MSEITWQKSSFSDGAGANCLELSRTTARAIRLRESDRPEHVVTAAPAHLAALLRCVKAGTFDRPTHG